MGVPSNCLKRLMTTRYIRYRDAHEELGLDQRGERGVGTPYCMDITSTRSRRTKLKYLLL